MDLPDNVKELLLRVGDVEWNCFEPGSPEDLGQMFQGLAENTMKSHGLEGDQTCHWVGTEDKLSVAMVGISPNSGLIAMILAAGWNLMVEEARAQNETTQHV